MVVNTIVHSSGTRDRTSVTGCAKPEVDRIFHTVHGTTFHWNVNCYGLCNARVTIKRWNVRSVCDLHVEDEKADLNDRVDSWLIGKQETREKQNAASDLRYAAKILKKIRRRGFVPGPSLRV